MLNRNYSIKLERDEPDRLAALAEFAIEGVKPDVRFDAIARTAGVLLRAPFAFISFVDEHKTRFKSAIGFEVTELPRDLSFCEHVICQDEPTIVKDATRHERFADHPLVAPPFSVKFYAAAPIIAPDGSRLGAIGVFDRKSRLHVTDTEVAALRNLAELVMDQLQSRKKDDFGALFADAAESMQYPVLAVGAEGLLEFANHSASQLLGFQPDELLQMPLDAVLTGGPLRVDTRTLLSVYSHARPGHVGKRLARMAIRKDGTERPVEISVAPWCGPRGSGVAVTIHERGAIDGPVGIFADMPGERSFEATARIEDELGLALARGEFLLHFQPQVLLSSRMIYGAEALIRWQHPRRGLLTPQYFLRDIEESGLVLPFGWWILDAACAQAARWNQNDGRPIRIGVNLFSAQYRSPELVDRVGQALAKSGLRPDLLELEITETITLLDDEIGISSLRALRKMGVRIAFDDFGTGYASLSSLQNFPLTTLKLDRSFVRDILYSRSDAVITRSMISLARDLGLECIAEGIETPSQHEMLENLGCDAGQGYFYGRPVPASEIGSLLRTTKSN